MAAKRISPGRCIGAPPCGYGAGMVDEDVGRPAATMVLTAGPDDDPTLRELEFVGTATVILRVAGYTILTDPNFLHQGEHAYLGMGLRSRRQTQPSRDETNLPPIDLVVLSHHHGDHFDHRAARGLRKDLPIVTEPHAARKLGSQGFTRAIPL